MSRVCFYAFHRQPYRKPEATRLLRVDDPRIAANLEKDLSVRLVVRRLEDGQVLGQESYMGLSGFEPRVAWLTKEVVRMPVKLTTS
jgi:hypothetical protein